MYIYENKDWTNFYFDEKKIYELLSNIKMKQGILLGKMAGLGFSVQSDKIFNVLTSNTIKTSEIEGEKLNIEEVRSSVARKLEISYKGMRNSKNVDGIVEMIYDATQNFSKKVTKTRVCAWHKMMFPQGISGNYKIRAGKYRDDKNGKMQVVSGYLGREKVHYIAPDADTLDIECAKLYDFINKNNNFDPIIKAGIIHLWFVILHPFDDGNGRIARALADLMLARGEKSEKRFYSMSEQINDNKKSYYEILEKTQKGTNDITDWLSWFLENLGAAIEKSEKTSDKTISKAHFWEKNSKNSLNARQIKILNMLLENFEGNLTSTKWAKICNCSQDTASRDIEGLINLGILVKHQKTKSAHYTLSTSI